MAASPVAAAAAALPPLPPAPAGPRHAPDVLWRVMFIAASHGHVAEVAAVTCAVPDLRDDGELLALTRLVATRE
jgi:hypothetical protein